MQCGARQLSRNLAMLQFGCILLCFSWTTLLSFCERKYYLRKLRGTRVSGRPQDLVAWRSCCSTFQSNDQEIFSLVLGHSPSHFQSENLQLEAHDQLLPTISSSCTRIIQALRHETMIVMPCTDATQYSSCPFLSSFVYF